MSMAVNMTRKKTGETRANSTKAWLFCPRTTFLTGVRSSRTHALKRSINSSPQASRTTRLSLLNARCVLSLAAAPNASLGRQGIPRIARTVATPSAEGRQHGEKHHLQPDGRGRRADEVA